MGRLRMQEGWGARAAANRWSIWLPACVVALASACGPAEDAASLEPDLAVHAEALSSAETHSTCSAEQLTSSGAWDQRTCEGPWAFTRYTACYQKIADDKCTKTGEVDEPRPNTCTSHQFGLSQRVTQYFTQTVTPIKRRVLVCPEQDYKPCVYKDRYDAQTPCEAVAQEKLNAVPNVSDYRSAITIGVIDGGGDPLDGSPSTCTVRLDNYPRFNSGTDASICGTYYVKVPVYEACRSPLHPLTADPAECYNEASAAQKPGLIDMTRVYSPTWLTLAELRSAAGQPRAVVAATPEDAAPRCTTADELPVGSDAEVGKKFERLRETLTLLEGWSSSGTGPIPAQQWPLLRREVVFRLERLFELEGTRLSPQQQEFMLGKEATATTAAVVGLYQRFPGAGYRRMTRTDPTVDFGWNGASPFPGVPGSYFSVRWTGTLVAPQTGTYQLHVATDDGARLWVNGQPLVDKWMARPEAEDTASFPMVAGIAYDLRFDMYQGLGASAARLRWTRPDGVKERIPAAQLRTPDGATQGLKGEYFDDNFIDQSNYHPETATSSKPRLTADLHCGNPWTSPVDEASCAGARDVNALLDLCHRLSLDSTSLKSYLKFSPRCHDVLPRIAALTSCTAAQREALFAAYDQQVRDPLGRLLLRPNADVDGDRVQALHTKLSLLEGFYRASLQHRHAGNVRAEALEKDARHLLTMVWSATYGAINTAPPNTPTDQALFASKYLEADAAMLEALVPDAQSIRQPPVASALLLMALGDALKGVSDRLGYAAQAHDLACMFKECGQGQVRTPVSRSWALLDGLRSQGRLTSALGDTGGVPAAWVDRFKALRARYSLLEGAVGPVLGHPPQTPDIEELLAMPSEQLPALAVELSRLLHSAQRRNENYRAAGLFEGSSRRILMSGLGAERQAQVEATVYGFNSTLFSVIEGFENQRDDYVARLLNTMDNVSRQEDIENRVRQLLERSETLSKDLAGLHANVELAELKRGQSLDTFIRRAKATTDPSQRIVMGPGGDTLTVRANATQWTRNRADPSDTLESMVAPTHRGAWKLDALAGDLVQIDFTQNQWSPTCAAQRLQQAGLEKLFPYIDFPNMLPPAGTKVGPEGFLLTQSEGAYRLTSNTQTTTDTDYNSGSWSYAACAGVKFSYGWGAETGLGFGAQAYLTLEGCRRGESGSTHSESTSDQTGSGHESRTSASYFTGLRLAGTPFPSYPAGSLLLLEVPDGGTLRRHIRNVHVLQSGTNAFSISESSDLYLVVNDRVSTAGATCTTDGSGLTFNVTHARTLAAGTDPADPERPRTPTGALAQLGTAMVTASEVVWTQGEPYLAQGRITASELGLLRTQAINALQDELDTTPMSNFPPNLLNLFFEMVDRELALLERKVQAQSVLREKIALELELKSIHHQLRHAKASEPLLNLLTTWQLRNVEAEKLDAATRDLVTGSREYLFPSLRLLYPSAFSAVSADTAATGHMNRILAATWDGSSLETAKDVNGLVTRVRAALDAAKLAYNNQQPERFTVAAVSFPRPGLYPWVNGMGEPDSPTPWSVADPQRSQKVWDAIAQGGWAEFEVRPEDLYQYDGGTARLVCGFGTPIVRTLGLFLAYKGNSDPLNSGERTLTLSVGRTLGFTGAEGLENYDQLNADWLQGAVHVKFGVDTQAVDIFKEKISGTRVGGGLSPFGTFKVLTSQLAPQLAEINQAILLFEVEKRIDAASRSYIATCDGPPPPALNGSGALLPGAQASEHALSL